MFRALPTLALCGVLVAGCHSQTRPTKSEPPASSEERSTREAALQPPHGQASVDALIANLQRGARANPNKGDFWDMLGRAWIRKARETTDAGFYINAKAAADVALKVDPFDRAALELEGLALLNQHRFEEARGLAQTMVDARPDDATAHGLLSDALLELGHFDDAVRAAQRMVDLKPNLPSYSRAAYLRWLAGDIPGAKRAVRLAIDSGSDRRDPEPRAWVLVQAALVFCHEGDYRGADAGFDRALEQVADFAPALVGKARVAMARGDGPRAADLLARAYEMSPLIETAWLLGDARTMAGDVAGAQDAYTRVERIGKRSDPRSLALFWATRSHHNAEALALAAAERTVRDDVYTEDVYAWALYRNGRIAEARAASDRALALGTRDARLLYHAGAIRIAAGERQSGLQLVHQALTLDSAFDVIGAAEARKLWADGQPHR
jgi:tetratricopeptide (TPR) repeat protein